MRWSSTLPKFVSCLVYSAVVVSPLYAALERPKIIENPKAIVIPFWAIKSASIYGEWWNLAVWQKSLISRPSLDIPNPNQKIAQIFPQNIQKQLPAQVIQPKTTKPQLTQSEIYQPQIQTTLPVVQTQLPVQDITIFPKDIQREIPQPKYADTIDLDVLRQHRLTKINTLRWDLWLPDYVLDDNLNMTAQVRSDYHVWRTTMSHRRYWSLLYYSYPLVIKWFNEQWVGFEGKSTLATENIWWWYVRCPQTDCT